MDELFMPSFLKPKKPALPKDATVTMAYVPLQQTIETYELEEGLKKGTIFPQLNKEFKGKFVKEAKTK